MQYFNILGSTASPLFANYERIKKDTTDNFFNFRLSRAVDSSTDVNSIERRMSRSRPRKRTVTHRVAEPPSCGKSRFNERIPKPHFRLHLVTPLALIFPPFLPLSRTHLHWAEILPLSGLRRGCKQKRHEGRKRKQSLA